MTSPVPGPNGDDDSAASAADDTASRRSPEVKAAWVAAIAGSVVAAIISAVVSIIIVGQQAAAASSEAARQFLRDKQQAAYSDLLSKDQALADIENELGNTIARGGFKPLPDANYYKMWAAKSAVDVAVNNIRVIGTDDTAKIAFQISQDEYLSCVHASDALQLLGQPDNGPATAALDALRSSSAVRDADVKQLVLQARKDLVPK